MKTRFLLLLCMVSLALGHVHSQQLVGRQLVDEFPISQYSARTYGLTWLPTDYNTTSTKYPLLIFLHGSGEGGDGTSGLKNLLRTGLPQLISNGWNPEAVNPADNKNYKFIVVSPQAPSKSQWSYSYTHVRHILDDVIKRYRVDESRIYITGLSAGGGGSWSCVTNDGAFTQRIAAIVPVSATGVNNPSVEGKNIPLIGGTYGVKVWAVCGMEDGHKSHNIADVNTINNATPKPTVPAAYTLLPGLGHVSAAWNTAYSANWRDNQFKLNIFEWMLQYKRGTSAEPAPNKAPVAKTAGDISIQLPTSSVILDGSASTDADGTIRSYQWTKLSGPTQFTLTNTTSAKATLSNLATGTYVFELTVTDNDGVTAKAQVKVTVAAAPNIAPVANAGAPQSILLPINLVTLNGSGSKDADGSIRSYSWRKLSGPGTISIATPLVSITLVTGLLQGSYTFELTVTDNEGAVGKDTVAVTVSPLLNRAPVANAGTASTIQLPRNSIELNGSASTDPDGTIRSYQWSSISGPSQATLANAGSVKASASGLVAGTYVFELKVTDNAGAVATARVSVIVTPAANVAPVAHAGNNSTIQLPMNSVTLDGSASKDNDGSVVSFKWAKVEGPASFSITTPSAAKTTVTGLTSGTYRFELTVTDNGGLSSKATATIVVSPAPVVVPPVAIAGENVAITLPVNEVRLSAGQSYDPAGNTINSSWSKLSGPESITISNPNNSVTALRNLVEGQYAIQLKVTNALGAAAYDTISVVVKKETPRPPAAKPLVANAGDDQTITLPTNEVRMSASASHDPNGGTFSSNWSKISGPASIVISNPNNSVTALRNLTEGVYSILLTITGTNGTTATDTVKITVKKGLTAPPPPPAKKLVANAGADQTIQLPLNEVRLTSRESYDPAGGTFSSRWSKISGPASISISNPMNAVTAIRNLTEGVYSIQLTISNAAGAVGYDTVVIRVQSATPPPPPKTLTANAGGNQTIVLPLNEVRLSSRNSTHRNGDYFMSQWTKVSGPSSIRITNPGNAVTAVRNLEAGVYRIALTITDLQGRSDDDTISITVKQASTAGNSTTIATARTQAATSVLSLPEVKATPSRIFPNPVSSVTTLRMEGPANGKSTVTVFNMSGKRMFTRNFNRTGGVQQEQLNLSSLASGVYFVVIETEGEESERIRIVKL